MENALNLTTHYIAKEEPPQSEKRPKTQAVDSSEEDLSHEAILINETLEAFVQVGLPLHPELQQMLSESSEHRFIPETWANNRRGSGYMQATRYLADLVKQTPAERVKKLFDEQGLKSIRQQGIAERAAFAELPDATQEQLRGLWEIQRQAHEAVESLRKEKESFRELSKTQTDNSRADEIEERYSDVNRRLGDAMAEYSQSVTRTERAEDKAFPEGLPVLAAKNRNLSKKVIEACAELHKEEDLILGYLITGLMSSQKEAHSPVPTLKSIEDEDLHVGSCTTAELYFLELLTPDNTRPGRIINGDDGQPLMIFKQRGDSSAMTLREVTLNGITLPPGSLLAVKTYNREQILNTDQCAFEFLRLTTLAVSPKNRERAFGTALEFQRRNGFPLPETATVDDLRTYAEDKVSEENLRRRISQEEYDDSTIF